MRLSTFSALHRDLEQYPLTEYTCSRARHRSSKYYSTNRQCRFQPSLFRQSIGNVSSSPSIFHCSFDNFGSSPSILNWSFDNVGSNPSFYNRTFNNVGSSPSPFTAFCHTLRPSVPSMAHCHPLLPSVPSMAFCLLYDLCPFYGPLSPSTVLCTL